MMEWNGYIGDEAECINCGERIKYAEFELGQWGWLHPHTGWLDCGPDPMTATDAEPKDPENVRHN